MSKEPPRRVTVVTRIGSVLPLLSSATGLVFAAYLPAEEIEALKSAENRRHDARQGRRETGGGRACQTSARGSREGRRGRPKPVLSGIDAIAAPAFAATGRIAAVITVLGPTTSFDASTDGRIARAVTSTAALLSNPIGLRAPLNLRLQCAATAGRGLANPLQILRRIHAPPAALRPEPPSECSSPHSSARNCSNFSVVSK